MRWLRRIGWRRAELDREMEEEYQFDIDQEEARLIGLGMAPAEARVAARRAFGNRLQIAEVTGAMHRWQWLEEALRDMRLALRAMGRAPVFTLTAILSLGLGIGANVASFSAADAFLLRPLPVADPKAVVAVSTSTPDHPIDQVSYPEWEHLQAERRAFVGVAGYALRQFAYGADPSASPQMRMGMMVTPGFFSVLGVQPALGRAILAEEEGRGPGTAAVVLGHDFWREQYGGDPSVVGRTLQLNGRTMTIIGIAPERFTGMDPFIRPALFVPIGLVSAAVLDDRANRPLLIRARLAPDTGVAAAQGAVAALGSTLAQEFPLTNAGRKFSIRTELAYRVEQSPPTAVMVTMLLLLAAVVLAIACANVAGLLLGRARARAREVAIRLAIGAGQGRLVRQFLAESLVLALAGGAAGVVLALGFSRFLAAVRIPTDVPIVIATRIDWRALGFALGVSVVSAFAFGLLPALRASRTEIGLTLKSGGGAGRAKNWGRRVLVGGQVALALLLLVMTGTMLDAFARMAIMDPGMRIRGLLLFELNPGLVGYDEARSEEFVHLLRDRVRALPGVRDAALTRAIPFRPNFIDRDVVPEGFDLPPGRTSVSVAANAVDSHYFDVAGIPLVNGRALAETDTAATRPVAVVNQEFAKRYWNGRDPVGRRFRFGAAGPWVEVVGVARNAKYLSLTELPQPYLYIPFAQNRTTRITLMVAGGTGVVEAVLRAAHELDAVQPVYNVREMDSYYRQGVLGPALIVVQMVGAAGAAGLALALIGIYGLVAFAVAQRTREIGIRMAIGASRWNILRMVLGEGLALAGAGAAAGMLLSVPAFLGMSAALAGVGDVHRWTLVVAPVLLIAVSLAACYLPARRAAAIHPTQALRED